MYGARQLRMDSDRTDFASHPAYLPSWNKGQKGHGSTIAKAARASSMIFLATTIVA